MESTGIEIVNYTPQHQPWFEQFNRDWIEAFFTLEPLDIQVLQNPDQYILGTGGLILMAYYHQEVAGTVGLRYVEPGIYEFTKMAVPGKFQGKKIGRALAEAAIEKAQTLGAKKIILYSNTRQVPAIALYRKLGFIEIPNDGLYERGNIKMELALP